MTDDTIRAKRIELVDDQGDPVVVLTAEGGKSEEFVGVLVGDAEDNSPFVVVGINRENREPFIHLGDGGEHGLASVTFSDGRAYLRLVNADGSEQTLMPAPIAEPDFSNVPGRDILAIFAADLTGDEIVLHSHEGTGFLVGQNIIVTCWHCVRAPLQEGWAYVAVQQNDDSDGEWFKLVDIEQDHNGSDLATAWVNVEPEMKLSIAAESPMMSEEVWSYGYPLTDVRQHPDLAYKTFRPNPRLMQSYILRIFNHDQPGFGETPAYELDMPSLAGMSGAPIIKEGTRDVVGVLYGKNDAEQVEEFGSRDPDTGERLTPEVVRMTYFAVAHHTETLKNLRGAATGGRPLADVLND